MHKACVPISTAPAVDPAIIDRSALGYRTDKTKFGEILGCQRLAFSLRPSDIVQETPNCLDIRMLNVQQRLRQPIQLRIPACQAQQGLCVIM